MFMNKDQNLINEFAIKTLKENLNVMYAQIWREGQLTAEYKRMPVKTRLNTWSACKGVVSCAAGIALDEGLIRLDEKIVDIFSRVCTGESGRISGGCNAGKYADNDYRFGKLSVFL